MLKREKNREVVYGNQVNDGIKKFSDSDFLDNILAWQNHKKLNLSYGDFLLPDKYLLSF